jgi:hypothetical protein
MNQLELGEQYLEKIVGIWEKNQPELGEKHKVSLAQEQPLCFTGLPKDGLIILGLNPSSRSDVEKVGADGKINIVELKNSDIKKNIDDKDGYHNGLRTIVKGIEKFSGIEKLPWGHVDLFCFRETSAKVAKDRIYKDWDFFWEQMVAVKEYIDASNPKVILTNNAFTSDLILKYWLKDDDDDKEPIFDMDIGTYIYNEKTPIFLSGMLSGQSSLDKGNRTRLAWQIGRHFKSIAGATSKKQR